MPIVALITCKDKKEARAIAARLVKDRLAACVNIIGGVESLFWWEGKVDSSREALLLAKTKKANFRALASRVKSMHSYELPEIIALPLAQGDAAYIRWINDSCRTSR